MAISITRNVRHSFLTNTSDYMDTTEGAYYVQQGLNNSVRLALAVTKSTNRHIAKIANVFDVAATGLTIPMAVSSTIGAHQEVQKLTLAGVSRIGVITCLQKVTESIALLASSVLMFVETGMVKIFADVFSACSDIGDVVIAGDYLSRLDRIPAGKLVTKEVKEAVAEERTLFNIKQAKAIASVAVGVLGLLGLILGAPLVSSIVLLTLSVASSALAIGKYYHDKNRMYNDDQLLEKLS